MADVKAKDCRKAKAYARSSVKKNVSKTIVPTAAMLTPSFSSPKEAVNKDVDTDTNESTPQAAFPVITKASIAKSLYPKRSATKSSHITKDSPTKESLDVVVKNPAAKPAAPKLAVVKIIVSTDVDLDPDMAGNDAAVQQSSPRPFDSLAVEPPSGKHQLAVPLAIKPKFTFPKHALHPDCAAKSASVDGPIPKDLEPAPPTNDADSKLDDTPLKALPKKLSYRKAPKNKKRLKELTESVSEIRSELKLQEANTMKELKLCPKKSSLSADFLVDIQSEGSHSTKLKIKNVRAKKVAAYQMIINNGLLESKEGSRESLLSQVPKHRRSTTKEYSTCSAKASPLMWDWVQATEKSSDALGQKKSPKNPATAKFSSPRHTGSGDHAVAANQPKQSPVSSSSEPSEEKPLKKLYNMPKNVVLDRYVTQCPTFTNLIRVPSGVQWASIPSDQAGRGDGKFADFLDIQKGLDDCSVRKPSSGYM